MIISKKIPTNFPFIRRIKQLFLILFLELRMVYIARRLKIDKVNLKNLFMKFYPRLNIDSESEFLCIGCTLCEQICPTNALELKFAQMVNFPESLTFGELPMSFNLDTNACIQCGYCEKICPVAALSMGGHYTSPIVDLVQPRDLLEKGPDAEKPA